ncbi:hypothetical protein SLS62_006241 [Diatrype stigma]|uniref:Flavin reductase like domain-containing protein n=1 Tax=Diatrype stigma TaxID=117547 RepID=A0AAN9UR86_9PEZI
MSETAKREAEIKRNPHPDFKTVEGSRPDWDRSQKFNYKKTADPSWAFGDGANSLAAEEAPPPAQEHVSIDPYEDGRPAPFNYKLLISAIVPRPIGFVSTRSGTGAEGGKETFNLAPFSYFNVINHDPPLFALGVASPLESSKAKDTLRNLTATGECVVSIISEHFVEAANATSVDAPAGVSEWEISGLTPAFSSTSTTAGDSITARVPRVAEAVFSVECRLESAPREFESRATPGKKTGCLVVLEGTRFWVRGDALNADRSQVAPEVLRPIARVGGITYARVTEALELPRPSFEKDVGGMEGYEKLKGRSKKSKKE